MRCLLALLFLIPFPANAEFIFPQNDAQKDVDRAIVNSSYKFNIHRPDQNIDLPITQELLDDIYQEDKNLAQKNCHGDESLGTNCGLDFNPISCGNHVNQINFYEVIEETDNRIVLLASWNDMGADANKYTAIRIGYEWKIDSITCTNGKGFNEW